LLEQWKKAITVPIYKKGDKTDSSNYQGISLFSASHTILSNIFFSRLSAYVDEIKPMIQLGGKYFYVAIQFELPMKH
jgi:hypothetical protein